MEKDDLKCVLIGRNVKIYRDLAKLVRKIDSKSRFKQIEPSKSVVASTLKKTSGPTLIFISDEIPFSMEYLSDLVWQYCPDSSVVIVSTKSKTIPVKTPFNNTQFSRVQIADNSLESEISLQFLIQSSRDKAQFRRCKSLLGVSETRCQWLVDSSREAIAFISRDMHWYANTAYLNLFKIESIQQLRSITVKDLIAQDEQPLFESFQKNNKKLIDTKSAIVLSMKKQNGAVFRAHAYLIPSVFKGYKCFQLWIKEINSIEDDDVTNLAFVNTESLTSIDVSNLDLSETESLVSQDYPNPFAMVSEAEKNTNEEIDRDISNKDILIKEKVDTTNLAKEKLKSDELVEPSYTPTSLLKGVIRRNEARIIVNKLSHLQDDKNNDQEMTAHQLLSLRVAEAQKRGVDQLLSDLPENFNSQMISVFWDKVKLSRLLQILVKRKNMTSSLILRINEASINDETFIDWLIPGLKKLEKKSSQLIFLIPSNLDESQNKNALSLIKILKSYKCKVALDSFSTSKESVDLLKRAKPEYVRLSLPWVRQLHGSEAKEIRLSSMIRQLEARNIKVIAPCSFSKDMRKLFVLSGASFCQETPIKTA